MAKLNEGLEALESSVPIEQDKKPEYGRILVFLMLLLLLLGYFYWQLIRPPVPIKQTASPGVTHLFSIYGWGRERLNSPNGVAVDSRGNIYVADTGNHRVAVFNSRGNYRFSFGNKLAKDRTERLKKGALLLPLNVAIDDDNNIYVTSSMAGKLSIFDSSGKFKKEVIVPGIIKVVIRDNKLYVTTEGRLLLMNRKGKVLKRIGSKGKKRGQFVFPNGIAVDKKGNIFVSDTQNMRIEIFDKRGKLVGGKGNPMKSMSDADRLFGLGMGLALDDKENLYIADAFHHAIRVFSHDGDDFGEYGREGQYDGEFNHPSDIFFIGNGAFAIADKWNDRVQVVRIIPDVGDVTKARPDTGGQPWWVWLLLILIILVLLYIVFRWVRERRRRGREPAGQGIPGST